MGFNRETVKSKSKRTVKTEAATEVFYKKRCSIRKGVEISQNSQEDTCVRLLS